jgi:hypothetical protein
MFQLTRLRRAIWNKKKEVKVTFFAYKVINSESDDEIENDASQDKCEIIDFEKGSRLLSLNKKFLTLDFTNF